MQNIGLLQLLKCENLLLFLLVQLSTEYLWILDYLLDKLTILKDFNFHAFLVSSSPSVSYILLHVKDLKS